MKKVFFSGFLCFITFAFIQKDNSNAFSMKSPEGWVELKKEDILNNLGKFKMPDSTLSKFIAAQKGAVMLVTYAKYKLSEHPGLIPTIKVSLHSNSTRSFSKFFVLMEKVNDGLKSYLNDFEIIDKQDSIVVGEKKAVYFKAKFTMNSRDFGLIKCRGRMYSVPFEDKYYQITFIDGNEEDCSTIYDELVKTIKFQ
jgi:hypothetical protein